MRKLKAYLEPSLTTFCPNILERMQEKRKRIRATNNSFQFGAPLSAILKWEEISAFNILKHNKFEESRKVFAAKLSHVLTSTAKETD